jgi:hypothetical protein
MKKILVVFKSYFLQFLIGLLALVSYQEAISLGEKSISYNGLNYVPEFDFRSGEAYPSAAITSGFQGGAIAMGLICSTCLIAITLIEVNKTKH